ncbi:MAG: hypothetical protein FVQ85_15605 [Planctomycetes bacterium]|nr:hypothetical protein [Planctomycetota bacterium]
MCRCCREAIPSHIWRIVILLVLLVCHILSVEDVCRAEEPNDTYVSIPLALWFGDHKVLTETFLKCRVRRYSLSVSEFMETARDPEEKALGRLFRFIQENRDSLPDDLLPSNADQKTRETALKAPKVMGKFLTNTTVKAMVHIGENRVFIIEVADTRFARAGQDAGRLKFVMKSTDAGWRWDGFAKKDVLFSVILDSFIHEMSADWVFSECREDLRFEYALPSTTKGSPVYLQFNGRHVDVHVFADDSSVPTNDSVMQFYVKAWKAFQEGPIEWFLEYWDPRSRAKITKKFLDQMTVEEMKLHDQMVSGGRHAWLVLEAAPLSIVFVHSSAPMIKRFDYVRENPESDGLQLCGYGKMGFGEQLLASKEIGQILKKAAGTMLQEKPSFLKGTKYTSKALTNPADAAKADVEAVSEPCEVKPPPEQTEQGQTKNPGPAISSSILIATAAGGIALIGFVLFLTLKGKSVSHSK